MNVLIIGASGLVGGNCLKHFSEQAKVRVIGTYFSYQTGELSYFDTLNPENPENFDVDAFSPDVVVHCGALTHVDYCEANVEESYEKTVRSTINVIALCKKFNAKMVFISTDYVFDGEDGPYDEEAAVNPLGVYAKHKLDAERTVLKELPESIVIRITNVYGDEERKKNFVIRIIDQILEGQKLTLKLPVDQYATPVNAWDVARAIFLLITDSKSGIYNINSTDFVNRVELVEIILARFPEAEYEMEQLSTAELNQPAARPLMGGLINDKFMGEYPDFHFSTVNDYLDKFAN